MPSHDLNPPKLPRIISRKQLNLPDAYVIETKDLLTTFMPWVINPPSSGFMVSGFMDNDGKVHFEFNHSLYDPQKFLTWKTLFQPQIYYEALVRDFLGTSVLKDEKKLIAGGHALINFEEKDIHLLNLVILPPRLLSEVSPDIRKKAIYLFQEAFDHMSRCIGMRYAHTSTLVIPDSKMQSLGWKPEKIKGFKEWWNAMKAWWPVSLRGIQRQYRIEY